MHVTWSGNPALKEVKEFTVIAYAHPKTRPWSGLSGDTAVSFREEQDGSITVTVQKKGPGPGARVQQVTEYIVRLYEG